MSLSDRVIVMYKGKISGEVSPKEVSMAAMGLLMAGIGKEEQDHEKKDSIIKGIVNSVLPVILAFAFGAIVIAAIGESPLKLTGY